MKDLSGDGKITKKDVLIGRGVIARKKGGMAKSSAQTSVIKGASVGGSREGSTIKGCLLYTSPSPRDGLLSRMPSSA